ncbi:helix-turn-helix domain-containing protein [Virgibacillus natechei]|uniref:helix-turn-helix domain-containing protein n=1 Tax=Virgibacillus sp. CBA3643 TaxID=2942278 RepID=UPI0035A3718E
MAGTTTQYTKETKIKACQRYVDGEAVASIVRDLNIRHRDNVYEWMKKYEVFGEEAFNRKRGRPKRDMEEDSRRIARMEEEIDMLKKGLGILSKRR